MWEEESASAGANGKRRKSSGGESNASVKPKASVKPELDAFLKTMPTDLTLVDCIIDKAKHKTAKEQRAYHAKKMLEMAREGQDKEDGWEHCGKTPLTSEIKERIDIYARAVKWSGAKQYRSVAETSVDVRSVFVSVRDTIDRTVERTDQEVLAKRNIAFGMHSVFLETAKDWATGLQYRAVKFPWPLSSRDFFILVECSWSVEQWFTFCGNSLERPFCPQRNGFVRAKTKYQGFVGTSLAHQGGTRLTALANIDFVTSMTAISSFFEDGLKRYMVSGETRECTLDS